MPFDLKQAKKLPAYPLRGVVGGVGYVPVPHRHELRVDVDVDAGIAFRLSAIRPTYAVVEFDFSESMEEHEQPATLCVLDAKGVEVADTMAAAHDGESNEGRKYANRVVINTATIDRRHLIGGAEFAFGIEAPPGTVVTVLAFLDD